jgi:hypothetical protein
LKLFHQILQRSSAGEVAVCRFDEGNFIRPKVESAFGIQPVAAGL